MASSLQIEKVDRPELAKHDSSILDLVFVMDCTSSMGPYIASALENIRLIVEEIVVSEKSDVHLALVEYRDHPPQDHTFVTRVHDFTARVNEMKGWLQQCQAFGGGDFPEAVADGLYEVLKLSWRTESTKICILISDAPPHGLSVGGDGFPNGCPLGLDPIVIVREMAKKSITLYSVGVEPSIVPYRDFFMSLAYITGGQYVPMGNATLLAKVIIGGAREEISLDRLMQDAQADINREMQRAEAEGVDEKEKIRRIQNVFSSNNFTSTQMCNPFGAMSTVATDHYSKCSTFGEMKSMFVPTNAAPSFSFGGAPTAGSTTSFPMTGPTSSGFTFGLPVAAPTTSTSNLFSFATSTNAPATTPFGSTTAGTAATSSGFTFGPSAAAPTISTFSPFSFPTSTNAPATSPFGSTTTGPAATSSGFTFGSSAAAPTASTFSPFSFATSTNAPATTPFGSTTTGPAATSSGFTFGSSAAAPTTAPTAISNGFTFSSSNAAATTPMFGTGTAASTSSPFTFATPTNAPTIPTFGMSSTSSSAFPSSIPPAVPVYEVAENQAVNEDQAARVYQKWQNRNK